MISTIRVGVSITGEAVLYNLLLMVELTLKDKKLAMIKGYTIV